MTAVLQGVWITNFEQSYNDKGSSADADVQFWSSNQGGLLLPLGDICEASPSDWIYNSPPRGRVLAVSQLPGVTGVLLQNPVDFTPIWSDTGSGAELNGTVWQMTPPQGFVAIGHVVTTSSMGPPPKPYTRNYWCVASSLVTQAQLGPQIWDDEGSSADTNVGIWRLVPTTPIDFQDAGTFFATTSHNPTSVTAFVLQAGVVQFS